MEDKPDENLNKTMAYESTPDIEVTKAYANDAAEEAASDSPASTEKIDRTETHDLGAGDRIELNRKSYEIVEVLVGDKVTGEAVIYKIKDDSGQILVLKLYYQFENPRNEPRREPLERIKSFNHQNVLKLHDFGTGADKYQGRFCFEVCEYAEGGDLLSVPDITRKYTLELVEDSLIPQLLEGLKQFHDAKIYHCDLKPQNVFYIDKEQTKIVLADYGSAKTRDEESEREIVKTSMVKGTEFYLAPEQARGVVSEKNDYYSLGMILLHLLYPEKISTENLNRIIERQFAGRKIIEYSTDPEYRRLNSLIEGLTLQDLNDRWGSDEVDRWVKGEEVEVVYPATRETVPIKLGAVTIRTEQDLLEYIETTDNWYKILVDDSEGYHMLLTWITSLQDFQRKQIFDRMIQYYREDGEWYLGEAISRYFNPRQPVQAGDVTFDLYAEEKFTDLSNRFVDSLSSLWKSVEFEELKFIFFQFEFTLGQVMVMAEPNLRAQISIFMDKIAVVFDIDPKVDYSDCQAVLYTQFSDERLVRLFHAFDPGRKFIDHEGREHATIEEVGIYFGGNEEKYDDRFIREELRAYCRKLGRKELLDLNYQSFLTTLLADRVKYDIEIVKVQFIKSARGNTQISYKLGKSLAAFFREHSIDKSFIESGKRIETVVVNRSARDFIAAVTAKHKIDEAAIDDQIKDRLADQLKKAKKAGRQRAREYGDADTLGHLKILLLSFLKSVVFLLPLFTMFLLFQATFQQHDKITQLLNTITPFSLTLNVDFSSVKGVSLYGIHFLILLSFIPTIILHLIERIEISQGVRRVFLNLGLFLLIAPLISMLATYLVIVSAPVWNAILSIILVGPVEPDPDFIAKLFYYSYGTVIILLNVFISFALRREFRFIPFLFSLGAYFYLALMLHDYELVNLPASSPEVDQVETN